MAMYVAMTRYDWEETDRDESAKILGQEEGVIDQARIRIRNML